MAKAYFSGWSSTLCEAFGNESAIDVGLDGLGPEAGEETLATLVDPHHMLLLVAARKS